MSLSATYLVTNINGAGGGLGGFLSGLSTTTNDSVLIGQFCATNNTEGHSNTIVGNSAAANSVQGSTNVLMGFEAAPNIFSDNNVFIGAQVAKGEYVSGYANVGIGNYAAPSLSGGFSNVLVGTGADTIDDGNYLTALGGGASSTTYGVAIGYMSQAKDICSIAIGINSFAQGTNSLAIGSNVSSSIAGSINIMNRIVGYYSPINSQNQAPINATYVLQANVDALKITGGGVIAFCAEAGGGYNDNYQVDPAPQWIIGASSNDLAFTSSNGAVVKLVDDFRPGLLDFTAQHRCVWCQRSDMPEAIPLAGRIVIANGKYQSTGGATVPTADEAVPMVELATDPMDPRAFGVLSGDPVNEYRIGHLVFQKEADGKTVVVNSAGEGGIWVSDENGPIRNGDLVTTGSSIPGVAVRQYDDLVHSYTVAKITCREPFNGQKTEVEIDRRQIGDIRVSLLGCTYKF